MVTVREVINYLESYIPRSWQESWDSVGLHTGSPDMEVKGILLAVDFTCDVLQEAIDTGCNLVITHHNINFPKYVKGLTGETNLEKVIIKAIKNDLALYSMHTNLDFWINGINKVIADKLGLKDVRIFQPKRGELRKLVTFVPRDYAEQVRNAIFEAGAGVIGNYDSCSYNVEGYGTFRAQEGANPFVGEIGKVHYEEEVRVETIFPKHLTGKVVSSLLAAHPYEEVAYDIYPLENEYPLAGLGIRGVFPGPVDEKEFLRKVSEIMDIPVLKHSRLLGKLVQDVVICSGGCAFIVDDVIKSGADAFLIGDSNYHYFFNAQNNLLMVEAGHYETEKFAIDVFYDLLIRKFNTFVIRKISKNYNFVHYFISDK